MKKTLLILVALATLSTACVPAYRAGRFPGPYVPTYPYPSRPVGAPAPAESAVGRWDNVMLLDAGTPVLVLTKGGHKAAGDFGSADAERVSVITREGVVGIAFEDVMRVDRLPPAASRDYGRAAARGAAAGVGIVAIAGLLVGHAPPPNVFAAGALFGAAQSAQGLSTVRGAVTIYLAR